MRKFRAFAIIFALLISLAGCAERVGKFDASSSNTIYLIDYEKNETVTLKNGEGEDDFDLLVKICSKTIKKADKDDVSGTFGKSLISFETDNGEVNLYPSSDSNHLAHGSYDDDQIEYIDVSKSDMEDIIKILGNYGIRVQ